MSRGASLRLERRSSPSAALIVRAVCSDLRDFRFCCLVFFTLIVKDLCCDGALPEENVAVDEGLIDSVPGSRFLSACDT